MDNQKAIEDCAARTMRTIIRREIMREVKPMMETMFTQMFHTSVDEMLKTVELVFHTEDGKTYCTIKERESA